MPPNGLIEGNVVQEIGGRPVDTAPRTEDTEPAPGPAAPDRQQEAGMAMDVTSLSLEEWALLLLFQGNVRPGKAFDYRRMSQEDWDALFCAPKDAPT